MVLFGRHSSQTIYLKLNKKPVHIDHRTPSMLHSNTAIYTLMIINPQTDFWNRENNCKKKITQLTFFLCPLLSVLLTMKDVDTHFCEWWKSGGFGVPVINQWKVNTNKLSHLKNYKMSLAGEQIFQLQLYIKSISVKMAEQSLDSEAAFAIYH